MEKLKKLTLDRCVWSNIRAFGETSISRLSLFIPLIGYLIIFNDTFAQYAKIHIPYCASASCDVSGKLIMIYISGSLFGFGSILYMAFCPYYIKKYRSDSDFFAAEKEYFCHPDHRRRITSYLDVKFGGMYQNDIMNALRISPGAISLEHAHTLSAPLSLYYDGLNREKITVRVAISVFYVLGCSLFAISSGETFLRVLYVVVGRMLPTVVSG